MKLFDISLMALVFTGCASTSTPNLNELVRGSLGTESMLEDRIEQEGQFNVAIPNRPERAFDVRVVRHMVKGEGDSELEIRDTTDGTVTAFALQDEEASGVLTTPDGASLAATYNEDESISVNGEAFATPEEASDALFSTPEADSITPESLLVAATLLEDNEEDTGAATDRGFVKKAVKWVWRKITTRGVCIKTTFYTDGSTTVGLCDS